MGRDLCPVWAMIPRSDTSAIAAAVALLDRSECPAYFSESSPHLGGDSRVLLVGRRAECAAETLEDQPRPERPSSAWRSRRPGGPARCHSGGDTGSRPCASWPDQSDTVLPSVVRRAGTRAAEVRVLPSIQ